MQVVRNLITCTAARSVIIFSMSAGPSKTGGAIASVPMIADSFTIQPFRSAAPGWLDIKTGPTKMSILQPGFSTRPAAHDLVSPVFMDLLRYQCAGET